MPELEYDVKITPIGDAANEDTPIDDLMMEVKAYTELGRQWLDRRHLWMRPIVPGDSPTRGDDGHYFVHDQYEYLYWYLKGSAEAGLRMDTSALPEADVIGVCRAVTSTLDVH